MHLSKKERKRTKSTLDAEPDRISWLPGHVTDQIMSYLPIRDAVRTSVLSRNWRKKWYTLPNLVLDRQCVSAEASQDPLVIEPKFSKMVDHVLLLHSGPINMFKFCNYDLPGEGSLVSDVDRWILYLIGRSIKELVLEVWIEEEYYQIPWCLFSCQSLHNLKLRWCWLKPPMVFESFRNLKSLDLNLVTVDQDAFENMISKCPLLEKMKLTEVDGLTQINIHAPNLKFFEIEGLFEGITFDNTFQLATIVIDSWFDLTSESNPSRSPGCSSNLLKFFDHRPHIQSLEIGSYFLKYLAAGVLPVKLPTPCIDLSFLSLSVNFDNMAEILTALCLLRNKRGKAECQHTDTVEGGVNCYLAYNKEANAVCNINGSPSKRYQVDKDRYLLWVAVLAEQDTLLRFLNLVDEGNDFGVDGDMCMGIVVIVVGVQVLPTYSISLFT
ncbi:F-box/RNI/FBD-like domain protein [Medicago truncatula]|uniref:F-box/RNI/FBD-like domain protein n=1 Tax=Medicago truncatula TaxID=3880 RepID=G7IB75_MEDTR|nr:F-box/RNI/FBD-like domain protein [Medicago truncatula]